MITIKECWYKKTCTASCDEGCIRFLEVNYLMQHSGLPEKKQLPIKLCSSKIDAKIHRELNELEMGEIVKKGNNIFLCSENVGNGKTSWAIKLMHRYINSIWLGNGLKRRCLFLHLPTLLTKLKNFHTEHTQLKLLIETMDLVIWDEIGIPLSEYDRNILLSLIEHRINDGKSNVYTGNKTNMEDLSESIGERLASRIMGLSTIYEFNGADRRGTICD